MDKRRDKHPFHIEQARPKHPAAAAGTETVAVKTGSNQEIHNVPRQQN
jgi:hypothetical protein